MPMGTASVRLSDTSPMESPCGCLCVRVHAVVRPPLFGIESGDDEARHPIEIDSSYVAPLPGRLGLAWLGPHVVDPTRLPLCANNGETLLPH